MSIPGAGKDRAELQQWPGGFPGREMPSGSWNCMAGMPQETCSTSGDVPMSSLSLGKSLGQIISFLGHKICILLVLLCVFAIVGVCRCRTPGFFCSPVITEGPNAKVGRVC